MRPTRRDVATGLVAISPQAPFAVFADLARRFNARIRGGTKHGRFKRYLLKAWVYILRFAARAAGAGGAAKA
ncbi:MAG: hypothetical protein U5K56_07030 [Halioglobus sp.]|nr:hypothetical protein [Halioglobus sp.]